MNYQIFCSIARKDICWKALKNQFENGIRTSELSLYEQLLYAAHWLAEEAKMDWRMCECLVYAHGMAFTNGGQAAWDVMQIFFLEDCIPEDIHRVKVDAIKEWIGYIYRKDEEFLDLVEELFSDRIENKEVALVREIHRILKTLQPLMNDRMHLYNELAAKAINELKADLLATGEIHEVNLDQYIPIDMEPISRELSEEAGAEVFEILESFIKLRRKEYLNSPMPAIIRKAILSMMYV